jgi:3-dehydroshikimate dehydratase
VTPLFRSVALAAMIGYGAASFAATFTVTNTKDSGAGSLRQAILDSYRETGPNVIEFAIDGVPPYVIEVHGQFLPPLKGPLVLRMKRTAAPPAAARRPPSPVVVLDGSALVQPRTPSACPGATFSYDSQTGRWEASDVRGSGANVRGYYGAGLAVHDSHDVEISGIEIRNFCAGIVTVRSSNVYIHDVKIVDSHGAAGVIFTGDDGKSGRTDLSFNNRLVNSLLLDNGDGFEFTRGTHDSLLQGNTITLTQPLPEDGNAIEFAQSGDNNAVIGNTFSKYVDTAVTINGNRHTIRDNKFIDNKGDGLRANGAGLLIDGNTFADNGGAAMTVGGEGTRILDNIVNGNGAGIVVSSAGVEISRNSIHNNAKPGIDVAAPAEGRGGRAAPPADIPPRSASRNVSEILAPPVLSGSSSWSAEGITLNGSVAGTPGQVYRVEIFASRPPDGAPAVQSSGEKYLGSASAKTDANGKADFSLSLRLDDPLDKGKTVAVFTATATDSSGSTSKFSQALSLTKSAITFRAPGHRF